MRHQDAVPTRASTARIRGHDDAPEQEGAVAVAGGNRQKQGANQTQPSPDKEMADPAGGPLRQGNDGSSWRRSLNRSGALALLHPTAKAAGEAEAGGSAEHGQGAGHWQGASGSHDGVARFP